jgi:hypothetical protein
VNEDSVSIPILYRLLDTKYLHLNTQDVCHTFVSIILEIALQQAYIVLVKDVFQGLFYVLVLYKSSQS